MTMQTGLVIDGEVVATGARFDVVDPSTGQVYATAPWATKQDAERAIVAAKRAQPEWAALGMQQRQGKLLQMAEVLREHAKHFAAMLVREQGKPLAQAEAEVATAVMFVKHFATQDLPVQHLKGDDQHRVELHHKPLGVVVVIDPWNFPLLTAAYGIAIPLVAGNTVVLKPAPTTPLTALEFGRLIKDIFPSGVINFIADKNDLGDYLTSHPDVAKVTFTGSTATGRKVMASAAPTLKRLTLELGGNDAAIVLPDADVESAAKQIFATAFYNCGQICLTIKRVYVHSAVYDTFCEVIAKEAKRAVVGNGLDPATTVGPVQNAMQFEKAKVFLDIARRDGHIIAGGKIIEGSGFFVQPTIVRDISDDSELVKQEQFAPILPIIRYDEVDAAVNAANSLPYGLGGSVWSRDIDAATRIAQRLDVGSSWVNQHLLWGPHIPMAGAKQSGIGSQFGDDGIYEYVQRQVIWIPERKTE